jgi:hypothetical protein
MNRKMVASSNVRSIGFEDGVLEVEFIGGTVYQYVGPRVPAHYDGLMKAAAAGESLGKYMSVHVRRDPETLCTLLPATPAEEPQQ